jgi:hypothetical protein
MTGCDWQQAHLAEPVQRMALDAVMQGEPGLGQRPGDITGQRPQWVVVPQRPAIGIGQPPGRVGEFLALGEGP